VFFFVAAQLYSAKFCVCIKSYNSKIGKGVFLNVVHKIIYSICGGLLSIVKNVSI
jgi:hypothetical protein